MIYTNLGKTGLKVSKLCLGTMNFGAKTDEKEAFRIMDAALDCGINFFDTANNYGLGIAEEIIGRWFAQGKGRRERVVLGTKVHEVMNDPYLGPNDTKGLSTYKIRRHFEDSLKRLQTDHVEIFYMHHIDRNVSWDEIWDAFQNLFEKGKIDYVGSSNFPGWCIADAQAKAKERHFLGLAVEQHLYNLNCRLPELEVLPSAKSHGLGVVAWSPLHSGLLTKKMIDSISQTSTDIRVKVVQKQRIQLEAFRDLCTDLNEREECVALAWIMANPAITAPIIGPKSLEQLELLFRSLEITLTQDVMKRLDEIFPGPGGAAPEAYAW